MADTYLVLQNKKLLKENKKRKKEAVKLVFCERCQRVSNPEVTGNMMKKITMIS